MKTLFFTIFSVFLCSMAWNPNAYQYSQNGWGMQSQNGWGQPMQNSDMNTQWNPNSQPMQDGCGMKSQNDTLKEWGYELNNGPDHWGGICRCGKKQSPIDIVTTLTQPGNFGPITFSNYDAQCNISFLNNGDTVTFVGFDNCSNQPYISNGGLGSRYDLYSFHFHWGHTDLDDSEHTLDGQKYSLELHLLHIKHGLTFEEAIHQPDGVAVIAVWFSLWFDFFSAPSTPMSTLMPAIEHVSTAENQTYTISNFQVSRLLPQDTNQFYRYEGSLTTPTCDEVVIWTIMKQPQSITFSQMNIIRRIHLGGEVHENRSLFNRMLGLIRQPDSIQSINPAIGTPGANDRPVQPLNGRTVFFHG